MWLIRFWISPSLERLESTVCKAASIITITSGEPFALLFNYITVLTVIASVTDTKESPEPITRFAEVYSLALLQSSYPVIVAVLVSELPLTAAVLT